MVKLITKNTDYAIRALMTIALDRERFFSAKEIADIQDIPYHYLRRILQILTKNRLIESREGAGGGAKLIASPSSINVSDLIKMFQGDVDPGRCLVKGRICSNYKTCVLRHEIKRIERIIQEEFGKITIQTLLN
jgi:Rrf2 family protein